MRRVSSIARTIYSAALPHWPAANAVAAANGCGARPGVRTQSETMWEWPFRLLLG